MRRWIAASLNRKVILAVSSGLLVASGGFLVLFVVIYRTQLEQERSRASVQVNHLLQASLENAMLKRDLDGLREIVARLGAQADIEQVMILDPSGEVRFSSHPDLLGRRFAGAGDATCTGCEANSGAPATSTMYLVNEQGSRVLRSVNAVHNKAPCTQCHGPIEDHPINGLLFVDYDAEPIRAKALHSALALSGSGGLVIALGVVGAWWALRRFVLHPVAVLADASAALADGRLDARVAVSGQDELARLAAAFNHMAKSLQTTLGKVAEQEAFVQGVIDAVPDGLRVIGDDFAIVTVNQAYCRQLGTTRQEVIGTPCYRSSHRRAEPCCATLVKCPLVEIGKTGQPLRTFHQHVRGDGNDFLVEVSAAPMRIAVDGTERRLIVESIRDLTESVQYSHGQRLAELGQLAAGIAHEVHNPLAAMRLSLQAMLRDATAGQVDRRQLVSYLGAADGEIDTCIEVTERLLRLSAPPSSHPDLVSINAAVAETMSLLGHEAEQRGIAVQQDLDSASPRLIGAESDLRMVVLNLAQNAFHAMPNGGRLEVATTVQDGAVRISLTDTGVGIRPEDLPHVYEPFFSRRADGVRGTGLGLSICKAIVERYGGRIDLHTRIGEGTRFTVRLPAAEGSESAR